ncbi:MAG: LD-carboxypeptidase [Bacteroidales bacterium]|nr:LD-carboxypeptidase [Bacteroidales bacterium]
MITPNYLQTGDTVALVSPAGFTPTPLIEQGIETLQSWGLKVETMPHIYGNFYQFSGTDDERIADLQQAINEKKYKAIICVRGGYGCSRIVDKIDFSPLLYHPKWIVGFSDVTVFHAHLHQMGIETIHGAMAKTLQHGGIELHDALFGTLKQYQLPLHPLQRNGVGIGALIGGNLSLLTHLIATKSDMDYSGKILFIEDLNEQLYHLDRMMVQMQRSGKLESLAGFIVGSFSDMKDCNTPFGKTAEEIIYEHVEDFSYPVLMGFPAGHTEENRALYLGRKVTLTVSNEQNTINFL